VRRPRALTGHRREGRALVVDLGGPAFRLEGIAPGVLRVGFSPDGAWRERRPWNPVPEDLGRPTLALDVTTAGEGLVVASGAMEAVIDADARLTVRIGDRVIVADGAGGGAGWAPDAQRCEWVQDMPPGRRYYGFGERTGTFEKRGRRYTCWTTDEWRHQGPSTDALYLAVPWYLASDPGGACFGVYLDATHRSAFDLRNVADGRISMEVEDRELRWYLVDGPEPASVIERFTRLVGRPPLPPRWALGYHQARWSYGSEDEVLEVAGQLRAHDIPADAVHLDIDHMDGYRVFTWDAGRFPQPEALIGRLRTHGLRTTVVVDAAVRCDPDGPGVYAEGRDRGYFVQRPPAAGGGELHGYQWGGSSALPDHVRPEVRSWWGALYGRYLDAGVAGFLNDMNEPALHDLPF
jgi:alpha-glucosidase